MSRKLKNTILIIFCFIAVLFCGLILVSLLSTLIFNGIEALSLKFLFTESRNFGAEGGIFYQIIGSLLLIGMAALLTFPVALGTAIYKSEFLNTKRKQKICAMLLYSLNGIPSIVFGIFGLVFFVHYLNMGISWFVGSIILAIMILPTVLFAAYQAMNTIPKIYRESAQALGLDKWQVITKVILPQSLAGAVTGLLIGLARAIGETAPIMFIATAFSGIQLPGSFSEPVTALPTHILILAQQATNSNALTNAWGTSLVLIMLVFVFSILALIARFKLKTVSYR